MSNLPSWASWSYRHLFLPADYHSVDGFDAALSIIMPQGIAEKGVHATLMLALGMMLAEFNRTQFADPEEEASFEKPAYVADTPLGLAQVEELNGVVTVLRRVKIIILDSVVTNSMILYSDSFKQRQANLSDENPENVASSPAAEVEENNNPAASSPAFCSTRAQKISYLKRLSAHDAYQATCRLLRGRLILEDISGLPVWASWSFGGAELPESFYELEELELAVGNIETIASSVESMEST